MLSLVGALAFILQIETAIAKVYPIPENWNYVNNESLQVFPAYGDYGSYRLVSTTVSGQEQRLLSENGTFGLAFLNLNGTGRYYLSLMMGTPVYKNSTLGIPIWTANRNIPLRAKPILANSGDGLTLLNNGSSVAWSSPKQKISSLSLDETGNFKLLGSSGEVVWQSFDDPTDKLLPNQTLVTGQKLTSRQNTTSMSEGPYTLFLEASGVAIYYKFQAYLVWPIGGTSGGTNVIDKARQKCPGFRAILSYTLSGGMTVRYQSTNPEGGGQPCGTDTTAGFPSPGTTGFLELGLDGNLNFIYLDESGTWNLQYQLTQYLGGPCRLPLTCGSSGICRGNQSSYQCDCLDRITITNRTSPSLICSKPAWASLENCSNKYETEFVTLSNVTYFANDYRSPDLVSARLEDCLDSCRRNCSCAALFYDSNIHNCYFQQEILGSLRIDQSGSNNNFFTAFLKYQNQSNLLPLPSSNSKKKLVNGLVSGAASAAVVLACSILLLCYYRSKKAMADAELMKLLLTMDGPPIKFSYSRLVAATKGFSKKLGTGGFGSVYEGAFHDGKKVAVKRLHSKTQGQRQFISEVASLGMINHINIVKLFGFCADSSHRLLVYNYMPKGSLDKWIFANSGLPLSWSLRNSIALGIARGLAYLHEESPEPILHLDIKPQNILLDDNFVAKVADFGMARLLMSREVSQVVTGVKGTPGYLAPEWLLEAAATKKCDVYSYGMVLLELIGGRRNLDMEKLESDNDSWFFPAWAVKEVRRGSTMNIIDPKVREQARQVEAETLVRVALWCIQETPADRPTMTTVVQMLEGEQEISEPPMNFHFAVQATGILSITASKECTTLASFVRH